MSFTLCTMVVKWMFGLQFIVFSHMYWFQVLNEPPQSKHSTNKGTYPDLLPFVHHLSEQLLCMRKVHKSPTHFVKHPKGKLIMLHYAFDSIECCLLFLISKIIATSTPRTVLTPHNTLQNEFKFHWKKLLIVLCVELVQCFLFLCSAYIWSCGEHALNSFVECLCF